MDDFSLYILDIVNNSTRAGAKNIRILLREEGDRLYFTVEDDGCGMSEEQLQKLSDPFFTTRKTRKVGFGVAFLAMLAEMTGGYVRVRSVEAAKSERHGTVLDAAFGKDHIDFLPLGDLVGTVKTLIQGAPDTDFFYLHTQGEKQVRLDTKELRAILGEEISLAEPEVLAWIGGNLEEQYAAWGGTAC